MLHTGTKTKMWRLDFFLLRGLQKIQYFPFRKYNHLMQNPWKQENIEKQMNMEWQ